MVLVNTEIKAVPHSGLKFLKVPSMDSSQRSILSKKYSLNDEQDDNESVSSSASSATLSFVKVAHELGMLS